MYVRSCPILSASPRRSRPPAGTGEGTIQVVGGADQSEVSERLREVAQVFTAGPEFLRVQTDVIGESERLLEGETSIWQTTRARETLGVPEGAHREGALTGLHSVLDPALRAIAIDERVLGQVRLDGIEMRRPTWIGGSHEAHQRHEESRRVECTTVAGLGEDAEVGIEELVVDLAIDRV